MLLGALQFQIKQNSGFPRLGRVAVRDQPAAMLSSTCAGRYKGLKKGKETHKWGPISPLETNKRTPQHKNKAQSKWEEPTKPLLLQTTRNTTPKQSNSEHSTSIPGTTQRAHKIVYLLADGAGALRGCGLIVVAQLTDHLSLLLLLLLLLWLFLAS